MPAQAPQHCACVCAYTPYTAACRLSASPRPSVQQPAGIYKLCKPANCLSLSAVRNMITVCGPRRA